jgi:hypothetical protein
MRSGGYGPSVTVTSCEIGRASGTGVNFICDIYRAKLHVTLEGRRSTVSLIVKSTPAKEQMVQVNILFCLMIYLPDIHSILNRKTLSILLLLINILHIVYRFTYM